MALYVLFVAHDLNVNFHLCAENHRVMSSFGDASRLCEHCLGHHHHDVVKIGEGNEALHFEAKCCCEDYDSEISFVDAFTFSTEKPLLIFSSNILFFNVSCNSLDEELSFVPRFFTLEKIPYLLTGRLRTLFFSHLKLDPFVF